LALSVHCVYCGATTSVPDAAIRLQAIAELKKHEAKAALQQQRLTQEFELEAQAQQRRLEIEAQASRQAGRSASRFRLVSFAFSSCFTLLILGVSLGSAFGGGLWAAWRPMVDAITGSGPAAAPETAPPASAPTTPTTPRRRR
jgi:hypothetical protein